MSSDSSSHSAEFNASLPRRLWWYKPLIWAAFILLLYVLREFFLVGLLTFLFCFIIRSAVRFLMRLISPNRDDRRIDSLLTLAIFLGICLGLYGLGRYFMPPLIRQGKSLVTQVQNSSAEELQNTLLANTVGAWKFEQQFGEPDEPRYQKGRTQ